MDVVDQAPGAPLPLELAGDPDIERMADAIRLLATAMLAIVVIAVVVLG
jgi:hypothetical protein